MQTYDILMLIVLVGATIFGAIKGFAWQLASLASIVVSYIVAYSFRGQLATMINAEPPWNTVLAMLLLYSGSSFVIWMVFRMISTSIDKIKLRDFDRQLGGAFGLLKGGLLCLLITMFAMTLLGPAQQQRIANSSSGHYISKALANADGILPVEVKNVVGEYLANVERKLEQGRSGLPINDNGGGFDGLGRMVQDKFSEFGREALGNNPLGGNPGQGGNSGILPGGLFGPGQGGPTTLAPWNGNTNSTAPGYPTSLQNPAPQNGNSNFGQPQNTNGNFGQPQPAWQPPPPPRNASNPNNGLR